MKKPVRIQRSRKHKQVSPNGLPVVYVGRPSKWGNPYKVIPVGGESFNVVYENWDIQLLVAWAIPKDMALKLALDKFKEAINNKSLPTLKGKNLSCWCKIGEPCHADILLNLANP